MDLPQSVEGVAFVELLRGAEADPAAAPDLLVEVPHGADRRAHYDALHARLQGELPADLHEFFSMNTDVGAWAYGRATAEAILAADPSRAALLVRCLLPRTFVDTNRIVELAGGDLTKGGMSAGIPVYVRDEADTALLLELHQAYVDVVEPAFQAVCGAGGLALVPHTYGPVSVGIEQVDDEIVENLRAAFAPEKADTWPRRAQVDLLTRDKDGTLWAPEGLEEELTARFRAADFDVRANYTYHLHPATLGHRWSTTYPGRVLTLELRRDLLVEAWRWNEEMLPVADKVQRVADVLAPALLEHLPQR